MNDLSSKIETYRDNLRYSLMARFVLRFHAALIILCSSLITLGVDVGLLRLGLSAMMLRYPLAIIAGYGAFLLGVKMWLEYSGINEYLNEERARELVQLRPTRHKGSWDGAGLDFLSFGDEMGCMIVILIFFLFIAAGVLFFWGIGAFATHLFADVVLEIILAAGLVTGLQKSESSNWLNGVWRTTKYWLILVLIAAVSFAYWAQKNYPDATTLGQVFFASL
jgi:hypothetical protein